MVAIDAVGTVDTLDSIRAIISIRVINPTDSTFVVASVCIGSICLMCNMLRFSTLWVDE
jgi:hypothetical protein